MTETTMMWRKSTFCSEGACVEVAFDGDTVAVRDGKDPRLAPLQFSRSQWEAFIQGVKEGRFETI
jgi:hypothetical protein